MTIRRTLGIILLTTAIMLGLDTLAYGITLLTSNALVWPLATVFLALTWIKIVSNVFGFWWSDLRYRWWLR